MNLSTILTVCHNSVRCVTLDFADSAAQSAGAGDSAICDTHVGGMAQMRVRDASTRKIGVSARTRTHATPEVAP